MKNRLGQIQIASQLQHKSEEDSLSGVPGAHSYNGAAAFEESVRLNTDSIPIAAHVVTDHCNLDGREKQELQRYRDLEKATEVKVEQVVQAYFIFIHTRIATESP